MKFKNPNALDDYINIINKLSDNEKIDFLNFYPFLITFINNPSIDMIKTVIYSNDRTIIRNIEDIITNELKFEIIREDPLLLRYFNNLSDSLIDYAISLEPMAIEFIKDPSYEIKLKAVKHNGNAIQFIKNPEIELQLEAVKELPFSLLYIENPDDLVKLYAIKYDPEIIEYIDNPNEDMQFAAVNSNIRYLSYIKDPSNNVKEFVLSRFIFDNNLDYFNT